MINMQTAIFSAMNKLMYTTAIKQTWRKFKKAHKQNTKIDG